jgi:hypothetical protein
MMTENYTPDAVELDFSEFNDRKIKLIENTKAAIRRHAMISRQADATVARLEKQLDMLLSSN